MAQTDTYRIEIKLTEFSGFPALAQGLALWADEVEARADALTPAEAQLRAALAAFVAPP